MPRIRIFPYKNSPNLSDLRDQIGILSLKPEGTEFQPRASDIIINWGRTTFPWEIVTMVQGDGWSNFRVINDPLCVADAVDKLQCLRILKEAGVNVPDFTTDRNEAQRWVNSGELVFARTLTRASRGDGILQISNEGNQDHNVPQAPLYTRYKPKRAEYRVHVFRNSAGNLEVLDVQEKRKRREFNGTVDYKVRTWASGWVYCREGITCPPQVTEQGLLAVRTLGLDFGAVDIGFTARSSIATVYEINSAPGIEGQTLTKYASKFKELVGL